MKNRYSRLVSLAAITAIAIALTSALRFDESMVTRMLSLLLLGAGLLGLIGEARRKRVGSPDAAPYENNCSVFPRSGQRREIAI
jgi:hypothetical protein